MTLPAALLSRGLEPIIRPTNKLCIASYRLPAIQLSGALIDVITIAEIHAHVSSEQFGTDFPHLTRWVDTHELQPELVSWE